MGISDETVLQFIQAYKEEFNEELSFGEAQALLTRLVNFYQLLSRPLPSDDQGQGTTGTSGTL